MYRCEQPTLGREAVIKVLQRRLLSHDVQLQRFLREAQLASRLDHPYAAHIYAFGAEERYGILWIAMELVQGITLKRWLGARGPMPLAQFVSFFEHVAEVVYTAHQRGIVHRDLKPSNVMVIERAGRLLPKLLDFGVAKLLDGERLPESTPQTVEWLRTVVTEKVPEEVLQQYRVGSSTATADSSSQTGRSRLTPDGAPVGTPAYMAPEQWSNAVAVGPRADLYALGLVAYEALTGRHPFQDATKAAYIPLHLRGQAPPLGGSFPPALDRMFQRALAERPEDRWENALELAGALRLASGIGITRGDLPRIESDVRDAWLAEAPRPLAESLAELDAAHNVHQARDIAEDLLRILVRYLLAMALAMSARVHDDHGDPVLLELVRALARRPLGMTERAQLLRLLVRRRTDPNGVHPVPELLELVTPNRGGTDGLDPILALHTATDRAVTEDAVRWQLLRLIPLLTQLLRRATFVLTYALVVPHNHAAERWTGRRRQPCVRLDVPDGGLVDGHPMLLDRSGRVCVDLWPLVQAAPPTEGADPELFLFDGLSHHGALLIAAPFGLELHDLVARDWLATHVTADIERKMRMRDQIRVAAQQWQDRGRPDVLLWRGEVLADLERWLRHTAGAVLLSDLEASFVAATRRAGRRTRWLRRSLAALAIVSVLAGIQYRAMLQTRDAEQQARTAWQLANQSALQAELEEGRQALLHHESLEAQLHLDEAYRRGDRSRGTEFMLTIARQPLLAEQARLSALSGRMWSAAFSPGGQQIVTTDDVCARIWDARSHRLMFTFLHGDTVYDAHYSADGARLVTASGDGTVRIWDAANGSLVRELTHDGTKLRYAAVAISPDERLVAAIDMTGSRAHAWNAATGAQLAELRNDGSELPSMAFSHDGRWLATTGGDDVRVFDTSTWAQAVTIAGPRIHSMSFDPTGPRLATGTASGDAAIWEIPSGARVRHLRDVGESIEAVAFAPNGELVVTGSHDGAEQVWNARSGNLQSQSNYLRSKILSVEFDPTSTLMLASGAGGTVVVVDVAQGMPVAVLEGPRAVVRVAHFDPSSGHVVGASWDGTAQVWDSTSPYRRWSSPPISDDCGLIASLEPDRRFIAIGCKDHVTRVWDTSRGQLLAELPPVTHVDGDFASAFPAVSATGDRAAIARDNTVAVYELPGGRLLRTIVHTAPVDAVAFATTGHDLVSGSIDGSLRVTRDDHESIVLPASSGGIDVATILVDGRVVATDARSRLRVYDPDRNALLADLPIPTRAMLLRPSPNGRRLITVPSYTRAAPAALWDLEYYHLTAQLEGHVGQVRSARFVRGGQEILTTGGDGTARLWDSATGRILQTYRGGSRFLADATLAPDGSMVVAGDADGLLRFWDTSNGRPLWTLPAHKSHLIGVHFEGNDIVTRGFTGEVSRWTLPKPGAGIECDRSGGASSSDPELCGMAAK